jgi:hypothetical protein
LVSLLICAHRCIFVVQVFRLLFPERHPMNSNRPAFTAEIAKLAENLIVSGSVLSPRSLRSLRLTQS